MTDLNIKQEIFDNFCNKTTEKLIDEIYLFANDDKNTVTAVIWNIAEMILVDAMRHSRHIGGIQLEQNHMAVFVERMKQHREELGFENLH